MTTTKSRVFHSSPFIKIPLRRLFDFHKVFDALEYQLEGVCGSDPQRRELPVLAVTNILGGQISQALNQALTYGWPSDRPSPKHLPAPTNGKFITSAEFPYNSTMYYRTALNAQADSSCQRVHFVSKDGGLYYSVGQ